MIEWVFQGVSGDGDEGVARAGAVSCRSFECVKDECSRGVVLFLRGAGIDMDGVAEFYVEF